MFTVDQHGAPPKKICFNILLDIIKMYQSKQKEHEMIPI